MASGAVHKRVTAFAAGIVFGVGNLIWPVEITIATTAGCLLGLWVHPDLDQAEAWKGYWLWYPYGKLLKHRSVWSHFPILGTTLRVLYLGFFAFLVLGALNNFIEVAIPLSPLWLWAFGGLALSDTLHAIFDISPRRLLRGVSKKTRKGRAMVAGKNRGRRVVRPNKMADEKCK